MSSVIVQFDGNDYYNLPSDINLEGNFDINFDVYLNSTKDVYENLIGFGNLSHGNPAIIVQSYKGSNYIEFCLMVNTDDGVPNTFDWTTQFSGGSEEWFNVRLYRSGVDINLIVTRLSDSVEKTAQITIAALDTFLNINTRTLGTYIGGYYAPITPDPNESILNGGKIKDFDGDASFGYAYIDANLIYLAEIGEKIHTIHNEESANNFVQGTAANQGILAAGSDNYIIPIIELDSYIDQTVDLTSNIDQTVELDSYIG